MTEKHVTISEAAQRLGVSTARVSQLVREGRLAKVPYNGKSYSVALKSLSAYQRQRRPYRKLDRL